MPIDRRGFVAGSAAGAATECGDHFDSELFRQSDAAVEGGVMLIRNVLVGMNGIAVDRKTRDLQAARSDGVKEIFRVAVAGEELIGVAVIGAGEGARADLDGLNTQSGEIIQGLFERHGAEDDCEDANFHRVDGGNW